MRTLFLAAVTATFLLAGSSRADDARNLIEKALKAHGGNEKIDKFKAAHLKSKGRLEILGGIDFTQEVSFSLPDRIKDVMEMEVMGNKVRTVTVIKGDKVSINANGMDVPITDPIKEAVKGVGYAMEVGRLNTLLKDKKYKLSALGEIDVRGKPALGILVASAGQKDISLYFSKESGYLVKVATRAIDAMSGQEVDEERFILEYEKKEGILSPKKILLHRNGAKFLEAEILETKHLEMIDESEFQ